MIWVEEAGGEDQIKYKGQPETDIRDGGDERDGAHRPVEAELKTKDGRRRTGADILGEDEQLEMEQRQIEDGGPSGEGAPLVGQGVVGRGKTGKCLDLGGILSSVPRRAGEVDSE